MRPPRRFEIVIVRPTRERIAKAAGYDQGEPTREEPRPRAARLLTPWDRYRSPHPITGRFALERHQVMAGEQYATDYDLALLGRVAVGSMEPSVDGGVKELPTAAWAARARLTKAHIMLRHYEIDLLRCILLDGVSAEQWALSRTRNAKSGLAALRDALDELAKHYGMRS